MEGLKLKLFLFQAIYDRSIISNDIHCCRRNLAYNFLFYEFPQISTSDFRKGVQIDLVRYFMVLFHILIPNCHRGSPKTKSRLILIFSQDLFGGRIIVLK